MSPSRPSSGPCARVIDEQLLREWALPMPDGDGDKESRGRVLVVGGSREMPGAVILAGIAALRAGAGKLRMAVPESIAAWVATAVPEGRIFALPETAGGAIPRSAADFIAERANEVQSVLFGPGLVDEEETAGLVREVLPRLKERAVVLDAAALACPGREPDALRCLNGRGIITPHAGEMAACLRLQKSDIVQDPAATAIRAASEFGCVVALKGADTFVASPDGRLYHNRAGNVGLATSGSGDTLAGIIAGLAARGAEPLQAAVWGVHLHALAGDRLAERFAPLGFLARELLAEIPPLMARFVSPPES